ncbi:MAG TPA: 16S rRNA (cytosine(967)-C(5))-methyltransferase RsmB [bacterium]|nr:16S rRNA (cytosine(967)-C(5))-methyltransferase RsmB [bacterium]
MVEEKKSGARAAAFTALWRVEAMESYADIVRDELTKREHADARERALMAELTYGVLRWKLLLDYYLEQVADRRMKKVERKARIALRLGAYQLLMMDRIPDAAAVNESVALAPAQARGFANAVLRALAKGREGLKGPERIADPVERLSVAESHPRWLVEEWVERLGYEGAAALCRANNQRPGLTLRVNLARIGREALIRLLTKSGVEARAGKYSPLAVRIEAGAAPAELPGFADGLFAVQDEASQLAGLVLGPRPGELALDACAAPGTKSLMLMQLMEGRGRVIAVDVHEGRLKRMAAEAKRLGIRNVTRVVADASGPIEFPKRFQGALFDRVLVDAPCTGLGTVRRRPEIKWRRRPEDAAERAVLQKKIITNVASLVKPGGTLVYSTCTFTREENEEVAGPLVESGGFRLENPADGLPSLKDLVHDNVLRAWPHLTGTDGFTIFKLLKT